MRAVQQLFDLTGKTALVTGGSRGLGLQIAEALGEQGARVVVTSRKQADLDEAVAHLTEKGIHASSISSNLSDEASITPLVDDVLAQLGHVDVLVNNAGATWNAPAQDYPPEAWDKVMNLNLRSVFLLSKEIGKRTMIPRKYGRVINVASITGFGGNAPGTMQTLAYNTSKGALINFTRTLAGEWGQYGITVNALAPGFFPTKLTHAFLEDSEHGSLLARAPLQRLGDEDDLKGATALFASDAGKHITGQVLAIDGGVSAII